MHAKLVLEPIFLISPSNYYFPRFVRNYLIVTPNHIYRQKSILSCACQLLCSIKAINLCHSYECFNLDFPALTSLFLFQPWLSCSNLDFPVLTLTILCWPWIPCWYSVSEFALRRVLMAWCRLWLTAYHKGNLPWLSRMLTSAPCSAKLSSAGNI